MPPVLHGIRPADRGVRSPHASRLLADLVAVAPQVRREFLRGLTTTDLSQVLREADTELGTPYGLWRDDPAGFVTDILGDSLWSIPRRILSLLPTTKRTAVPSCFGSSKTFSAARAALWMAYTYPVGTALVVTIAPLWRQVIRQMWPEIRAAHNRAGLPGIVDQAQLKLHTPGGLETVVAYGIAAAPYNEAAVQGVHSRGGLLLVVDEAGGIGHTIGRNLAGLLVGEGARMLAIGNPPTDDEGSWFEGLCSASKNRATVIPISAYATPNLSGERAPRCRACPEQAPPHSLATHLVDQDWVDEVVADHGEDAPYVQSKVHARFPQGGADRVIPASWVAAARDAEEPEPGDDTVRVCDLGLADEGEAWLVRRGAWVRLGVDVAADGGDELAVARCVGDLVTMRHTSAGPSNANAVHVAGLVLEEIRRAEVLAEALGSTAPVRVKIDGIGVGWGVAGILQTWATEGMHHAQIVPVVVSESTNREPEKATLRPYRKRDEMWLCGRTLMQPGTGGQDPWLRLRVDDRTAAQLSGPKKTTNSSGFTVVEPKVSMRRRGLPSPDRGEAVLLAPYEPLIGPKRKKARLVV